jgi:glycerol-3-phosphate cytidylyltransferase-like family protein
MNLRILCFGTFDGIHDGHRAMLKEARRVDQLIGESVNQQSESDSESVSPISYQLTAKSYLVVVVAPDSHVRQLKFKDPRYTSAKRIQFVKDEHLADEVILGDAEIGSWKILKKIKPNIVALGYDQDELRANLEEYLEKSYPDVETETGEWIKNPKRPRIVVLSPHKPDTHHSRLLAS